MIRFICASFFILIGSSLFAENPGNVYVLNVASFTAGEINSLRVRGRQQSKQPFSITTIVLAPNTNYYQMNITSMTDQSARILEDIVNDGKGIRVMAVWGLDGVNDPQKGFMIWPRTEYFSPYPSDFGRNWIYVEKSTP